jgi:hypothetical protein
MTKIKDFPWYQRPSKVIYRFFKERMGRPPKLQAIPSSGSDDAAVPKGASSDEAELQRCVSLERQLADTQKLLERYFNRCEVLESELAKYKK